MHLAVDALGLPVAFEMTVGERHDSQAAPALIERVAPRCLLADKAYDSNSIREPLEAVECQAVIPSRRGWIAPIPHDTHLYKARSDIECTIGLLKQARRFATRYEKTLCNYTARVAITCLLCWLRI